MVSVYDSIHHIASNDRFRCFSCRRRLYELDIRSVDLDEMRIYYECNNCSNNGYRSFGGMEYHEHIEYNASTDSDLSYSIISGGRRMRTASSGYNIDLPPDDSIETSVIEDENDDNDDTDDENPDNEENNDTLLDNIQRTINDADSEI